MKFNDKLEFGFIILMNVMSLITTISLIIFIIATPKPKTIATVDLQQLIKPMIEAELKNNQPMKTKKIALKKKMKQLHEQLKIIAEKEHLILIPKEAVIAGANDYTLATQDLLKSKSS